MKKFISTKKYMSKRKNREKHEARQADRRPGYN